MKKGLLICIVAFTGLSCNPNGRRVDKDLSGSYSGDTLKHSFGWYGDSILTANQNFYQFIFLDSNSFKIRWGNERVRFESKRVFQTRGPDFLVEASSENAILLTKSCGPWCKQGIVLIFRPDDNIKEYQYLMASDMEHNLIAFVPSVNGDTLIRVDNFATSQFAVLNNVELCPAAFCGECIDSVAFSGHGFYIEWQGNRWSQSAKDTRKKVVDISSLLSK